MYMNFYKTKNIKKNLTNRIQVKHLFEDEFF